MQLQAASTETVDATVLALARRTRLAEGQRVFPGRPGRPGRGREHRRIRRRRRSRARAQLAPVRGSAGHRRLRSPRGYTVARDPAATAAIWSMRKKAVGLLGNMQGERRPMPFVEDTVVPPEHLADYIREFRAALDRRGLVYGMFGHVDAGCLHVRPALDMKDPAQEALVRAISDEVVALTRKYKGVLWGEHGKGFRSEYVPAFFGPLYPRMQEIKAAFDPHNQLNPGKIAAPPGHELTGSTRSAPAGRPIAASRSPCARPTRIRCTATATPLASTTTPTTPCARRGRRRATASTRPRDAPRSCASGCCCWRTARSTQDEGGPLASGGPNSLRGP
jgi:hypothetical protein